jgi:glycosyltransferase involved in cell wall biosynthesis
VSELDVLYVFRDARLKAGGLAIDIHDLANGLSARGHSVGIVTLKPPNASNGDGYSFDSTVQVMELEPPRSPSAATTAGFALGIGRVLKEHPTAVVHVYSCLPVYLHLAAMVSAKARRHPLTWTPMAHPSRRQIWRDYGLPGYAMRAFDSLAPRMARLADAVAAATRAEAEEFRRLGCPRVEVLPPGVHDAPPVTSMAAQTFRDRLGIGESPLVLTVAGRDERRKGVPFGLEAFNRLRSRLPRAVLTIVGSSDAGTELPAGAHALGRLPDDDLQSAYRAADVVFVPSSYEAFSRIVIEAWQQETPVVVTDGVGLAETVREGGGEVVPYGDADAASRALLSFLADSDRTRATGEQGRALVKERFLVSYTVDGVQHLYQELCHA